MDVSIVGAGPVGLTIANLLALRGHSVEVFEKQQEAYNLPRAIHFDGEAMRVFQSTGLADDVLKGTLVGKGMLFKDASDNVLIDWSRGQEIGPMGWHESYRFHQPSVEETLANGLKRFGNVTLRRGVEVTEVSQDERSVTLTLADGSQRISKYVVAADGTNSTLRHLLGIETEDLGFDERWVVVDALLKKPRPDLGDYSVQFCDPISPATYVRGLDNRRRWEMRWAGGKGEADRPSKDELWGMLARWITPEDADLERDAVYQFRSAIAEKWKSGRVFLAGDAAHSMPPFMGQGMCAGIRDAANLSWKLSAVLSGAKNDLLDSYANERAVNVRQFIDMTMRLGRLINQTGAGKAPSGQMKSIWPSLGEGIGMRDEIAGHLVAQPTFDGVLTDTASKHGFYVLADQDFDAEIPVYTTGKEWLREKGVFAVLVRPDGYALAHAGNLIDAKKMVRDWQELAACVPKVTYPIQA